MSGLEIVGSVIVLPTGMSVDDVNRSTFQLVVTWRGPRGDTGRGGYAIPQGGSDSRQLSRAGNYGRPQPFQQHQYRWDTLEEALTMARKHVDAVIVNGRTFTQWQEQHSPTTE
jgi:hypothetical protein